MYQWQSYEMRYLGKNNFLLAWSNRKPTEVQKFQLNDVSLRKSGIDTDRTCKFLHNSNTEGLVFKIVWRFFDIVICCFAIFQSSLLNKILLISKNRIPSHRFFIVWYLGSILTKFQGNSWNFHALLISSKKVRLQKNEIVFCIQSFRGVTTCG